jgi:hypothetical protein
MTAAAKEHRESIAIENAITQDPTARESWLKRQLLLEAVDFFADEPTVGAV